MLYSPCEACSSGTLRTITVQNSRRISVSVELCYSPPRYQSVPVSQQLGDVKVPSLKEEVRELAYRVSAALCMIKSLVFAAAVLATLAGAPLAKANTVYYFTGTFDGGTAYGELTLQNYTLGVEVFGPTSPNNNLVSFSFNAPFRTFTATLADSNFNIEGRLPAALPAPANLSIQGYLVDTQEFFVLNTSDFNGNIGWSMGFYPAFDEEAPGTEYSGRSHLWSDAPPSTIPEPASLTLIGTGLAVVLQRLRRRQTA
jgi:hypothetical protein